MQLHLTHFTSLSYRAHGVANLCANAADGSLFIWWRSPSQTSISNDSTFSGTKQHDS